MKLTILILTLILTACNSSSAGPDFVPRTDFDALADRVVELETQVADLETFQAEALEEIAALHEAVIAIQPRSLKAGNPNPVPIAPFYPVQFTQADCRGTAYITNVDMRRFATRHGSAVRFTLPGQTDKAPDTYGYIERGAVLHFGETGTRAESTLIAPGNCTTPGSTVHPNNLFAGWEVVPNTDDAEYERISGVPPTGFLEGNVIGDTPLMAGGDGALGANEVDIFTATGFLTRIRVADVPAVIE